jgi:hypothetical protein
VQGHAPNVTPSLRDRAERAGVLRRTPKGRSHVMLGRAVTEAPRSSRWYVSGMRTPAQRLEEALELADLAEEMLRLKLERTHPHASADEIDRLVDEWFLSRPGAELGDAFGRPITLPRRKP